MGYNTRMRFFSFAIGVYAFATLLFPTFVEAQGLVPACGVPDTGGYCELCHVVGLIDNVIDFIIIDLSWPVAAILFAYAGFLYLTSAGNPGQITKARSIFGDVAIGFIIILVAWLVVDTVMKTLVDQSTFGRPWNQIECVGGTSVAPPPPGSIIVPPPLNPLDRAAVEDQFTTAGIDVNNPNECPAGMTYQEYTAQTGGRCTSLAGMQQSTINSTIGIKNACDAASGGNCNVTVTGGTELGHESGEFSHETGYKVDLAPDPALDAYLNSLVGNLPPDTNSAPVVDAEGNTIIVRHEDVGQPNEHWDITVIPPAGSNPDPDPDPEPDPNPEPDPDPDPDENTEPPPPPGPAPAGAA